LNFKVIAVLLFFICLNVSSYGQFEIRFENSGNAEEHDQILKELDQSSQFLKRLFHYQPKEIFEIKVAENLSSYQEQGFPLWLGGFYAQQSAFIQPVKVLINKSVFKKTIFIEYAHFFIDSYSRERCPDWLNEMLSLYFYYQYVSLTVPFEPKNQRLCQFKDFKNLQKNLKEHSLSEAFFKNSLLFAFFIEKKNGGFFWIELLSHMKKGTSLEKAFLKKTKQSIQKVYENDFR